MLKIGKGEKSWDSDPSNYKKKILFPVENMSPYFEIYYKKRC